MNLFLSRFSGVRSLISNDDREYCHFPLLERWKINDIDSDDDDANDDHENAVWRVKRIVEILEAPETSLKHLKHLELGFACAPSTAFHQRLARLKEVCTRLEIELTFQFYLGVSPLILKSLG